MKRTKIVCTIGPASESKEVLTQLIQSGMNCSRHNFSHGDHEEHRGRMNLVREVAKEQNKNIAVMLDTKGPEIRTGNFDGGKLELKEGTSFTIHCGDVVLGDATKCSITYTDLYKDVKAGDSILIDDGLVGLEVVNVEGTNINCVVKNSGMVGNHKGVNVPGVSISLPAITEKDIADLKFGIEVGVDLVAASFIRKASDVLEIRRVLDENGGEDILIFSKIENQEGLDNIDEILAVSDGMMVARGDMGVEIPIEQVPLAQKMMISKCNVAGKPVITATQMLDSMIRNPRPTRAEASDIANAIFDGTDCIMLSGETANGKYPVEAVKTMARIAVAAEEKLAYEENLRRHVNKGADSSVSNAVCLAACVTASDLNAATIIAATETGKSAIQVAKYRPECPVVAVTPCQKVARKLALTWGVYPILSEKTESTDELITKSVEAAKTAGFVKEGEIAVIATGVSPNGAGETSMIKVERA